MSNVLISGSTGFVGKYLMDELKLKEISFITLNRENGDLKLNSSWENVQKVETVVHLAAKTFVGDSWESPKDLIENNLMSTINALDYCKKNGSKLIFISSYLYGNPKSQPISEDYEISVLNPYALSKRLCEDVCKFYSENYGVKIVVLRPFNVYGYGQNENFVVPKIIKQCINNEKEIKLFNLTPKRDFIYVKDLVNAIVLSLNYNSSYDVINIGFGKSYSIEELVGNVQKALSIQKVIQSDNILRKNEILDTIANISKAKKVLNWTPKFNLEKGLKEYVKTIRNEK